MLRFKDLEIFLGDRPARTISLQDRQDRLARVLSGEFAETELSLDAPGFACQLSLRPGEPEPPAPGKHATVNESPVHGFRLRLHGRAEKAQHLILEMEAFWPETIFCNGYNDWTGSREYRRDEDPGRLRFPVRHLLSSYTDLEFTEPWMRTDRERKRSHTVTYLKCQGRPILFLASLDESLAFTWFEFRENRIFLHRDLEGTEAGNKESASLIDLYIATGEDLESLFSTWFSLQRLPAPRARPASGYTTWYYHYNRLHPADVEAAIDGFTRNRTPIDFVQIDDGYQVRVGDWMDLKPDFGGSLRPLVERIHSAGFRAGLWLAPFVAESKSRLYREHPDWIARDDRDRPIRAGFNPLWSYWFYVLDLENEEVREYLDMVFRVVLDEWGFDLLKLDFLYAAALQPRHKKSRAEHLHSAISFLQMITRREGRQGKGVPKQHGPLLLGCGIPLSAAAGRFDYCRVGSDVRESWEDPFLKFMNFQERVSTFNSLISTIGRRHWNGRAFLNDPDVFYLRKTFRASANEQERPIPLSEEERRTLFLLNHIFGSLLFSSDPVQLYDEETLQWQRLGFPLKHATILSVEDEDRLYTIRFLVEKSLTPFIAFANLRDRPAAVTLPHQSLEASPDSAYRWIESPLTGSSRLREGETLELEPHASRCYSFAGSPGPAKGRKKQKRKIPHLFMEQP